MRTPAWRSASSSEPAPSPAGETRRMATVVRSVPEAASTRRSTSRLGTPPVPRISRELSSWPASSHGFAPSADRLTCPVSLMSSSLHGRDDLYLVAVPQQRDVPRATWHDVTVDGGRDAGRGGCQFG